MFDPYEAPPILDGPGLLSVRWACFQRFVTFSPFVPTHFQLDSDPGCRQASPKALFLDGP